MSDRTVLTNTGNMTSAERELLWLVGYDPFGGRPYGMSSQQREARESLASMGYITPVTSLTADGAWLVTPAGHRRAKHLVPTYELPDHVQESRPDDESASLPLDVRNDHRLPPSAKSIVDLDHTARPGTIPLHTANEVQLADHQVRLVVAEWVRRNVPGFEGEVELKTATDAQGGVTVARRGTVRVQSPRNSD